MIFGQTHEQRAQRYSVPHRWFAWYPVELTDGRWAWLRHVERQLTSIPGSPDIQMWRYREMP